MKKFFAVTMTAALVLPIAATTAAAQDEKITIEGQVFLDHNGNKRPDGVDRPKEGIRVKAKDLDSGKIKWEFTTGTDGRYRAVLPKGPRYSVAIEYTGEYTGNRSEWTLSGSRTDADFALRGYFLEGFTFVDANGDGEKQDDEKTHVGKVKVTGKSVTGAEVNVETQSGADGAYRFDLPLGKYEVVAPDLARNGLALAEQKTDKDIDWLTGKRAFPTGDDGNRNYRVDLRYFEPKGDGALEGTTISPAKDTYTVGEQIEVEFKLLNKGDVPGKLSVVVFGADSDKVELISRSDNVTGTTQDFETVAKLLPGESITVEMKLKIVSTQLTQIAPFARPFIVGGFKDIDHKNQGQSFYRNIKVVEKGTTTEPTTSTPSSSATTAPTSTTTTTAVAKAGNKSGLASTGASPLGFLALGSLLLAAGLSAFFVARRRRS